MSAPPPPASALLGTRSATAGHRERARVVPGPVQASFDELGIPLREVTFVVVDLETTGGSPAEAEITEIGAVKVRGGEVLGEFATLVNPGMSIPAFIAVLTGITDAMVAGSPNLSAALPAFLEFAGTAVLVAHNAPFDIGFLKAACARTGTGWPGSTVVDTARLARQVLTRDDAPDCKLATLARTFRAATTPNHRALQDARATVDVLHGLLERVGGHGVSSLEELTTFSSRVAPEQRRKRHLAAGLPAAAGVYLFADARGRVLYVGTSKDIRARVRTYFTASERRSRMAEMVALAESVTAVVCPTAVEAHVRELRLIAEHQPRYNRRSRHPERAVWLKLTVELFPRLSVVRQVKADGATYLGPFRSMRLAEQARTALHEALPLRQCTSRISPRRPGTACALAGMGRCGAPCAGEETPAAYARHVGVARAFVEGREQDVLERLRRRMGLLADAERYEDAATSRDRVRVLVGSVSRLQRLTGLTRCPELVAARATPEGGWELVAARYGRLVGSAVVGYGRPVRPCVQALLATAEPVVPGPGPLPAASAEETECVLRWLELPGVRLVKMDGEWSSPRHGSAGAKALLDAAGAAAVDLGTLAEGPRLRPTSVPVVTYPSARSVARTSLPPVPRPVPATAATLRGVAREEAS